MRFLIVVMLFTTGCALFDEDTPLPEYLLFNDSDAADTGVSGDMGDGGGIAFDAGDAGDLDAGDSGLPADAGTDASGADMPPPGPWQCSPVELPGRADLSSPLQLGSLDARGFVAGWRSGDNLTFVEVSADGSVAGLQNFAAVGGPQEFYIGSASEDAYYLVVRSRGLFSCSRGGSCSQELILSSSDYEALSGDWNGGDYLPYFVGYTGARADVAAVTDTNSSAVPLSATVAEAGATGFRMKLLGIPPSPGLTTPVQGTYVVGKQAYIYERLTSGDPITQTPRVCPGTLANVGKVIPGQATGLVFADVVDNLGSDVVVAEIECDTGTTEAISSPLIALRDWDVVSGSAVDNVFHVSGDGLGLNLGSRAGRGPIEIAIGAYGAVAAAPRSDGGFGVLTVDDEGVVELRSFGPDGECD